MSDPIKNACCGSCRWWSAWTDPSFTASRTAETRLGDCRKRAPVITEPCDERGVVKPRTKWPGTMARDFCGEHEAGEPVGEKASEPVMRTVPWRPPGLPPG